MSLANIFTTRRIVKDGLKLWWCVLEVAVVLGAAARVVRPRMRRVLAGVPVQLGAARLPVQLGPSAVPVTKDINQKNPPNLVTDGT